MMSDDSHDARPLVEQLEAILRSGADAAKLEEVRRTLERERQLREQRRRFDRAMRAIRDHRFL